MCILTSTGPTCKCPSGQNGNPFPGGQCSIDQCSNQRPCEQPQICIQGRCKQKCEGVVCGVGATCDSNTGRCVCEPNFVGNPDSICMPPITMPTCAPGCGINAHCEYGLVENVCSCNAGTFGNPYEGCQTENIRKCEKTSCGKNAICLNGITSVECQCKSGFYGNPYTSCLDIDECSSQMCGENAICINTIGSFDCKCKENYNGNPFAMCSKVQNKICDNARNCQCDSNTVQCPLGYKCDKGKCKNLCDGKKCGNHAACNPDNGECMCIQGYAGSPSDLSEGCSLTGQCNTDLDCKDSEICFKNGRGLRKCVDGCSKLQCGPNSACVTTEHKSSCFCADGSYQGNPYDSNKGCQVEQRVISLTGCDAVACGKNEKCILDVKGPICHCEDLYIWNPVTSACEKPSLPDCSNDSECPETDACRTDSLGVLKCVPVCAEFNCPQNSICVAENHNGECVCLPGFKGHVNDRHGCRTEQRNECLNNAQCSESEVCVKQQGISKCIPACSTIKCGKNSLCVTNNHEAQCKCIKEGYLGDPNDQINGCEKVPCVYNEDCPPSQLCNRMTHQCYDICQQDSCGENAICMVRDDRTSVCRCQPGFKGNPIPEVECIQDEVCTSSSCHPSAICEVTEKGPVCKCPSPRHIGDPYKKGCILKIDGECPNGNADCPLIGFVCKNKKCVNVCENECGLNALCKVNAKGKAECSCPGRLIGDAKNGCTRELEKCQSDDECESGICQQDHCKSVCKQTSDCLDGEKCIGNVCLQSCTHNLQCRNDDQVCINSVCEFGCRNSKNCADDETCIENKCQNSCQLNSCGPNSLCVARAHRITCQCPSGFEPNPTADQGCVRVPATCLNTRQCAKSHNCVSGYCMLNCTGDSTCAIGERCSDGACVKICYTSNNCLPGEICIEGLCQPGCLSDADCPHLEICRKSKCVCDKGFFETETGCADIDECSDQPCHPSAICENTPGSFRCICPEFLIGDPYDGDEGCRKSDECKQNENCSTNLVCQNKKCVDVCSLSLKKCSKNALCQIEDHVASEY